eukprot:jgi/Hompol1/1946/HPOL_002801-RA
MPKRSSDNATSPAGTKHAIDETEENLDQDSALANVKRPKTDNPSDNHADAEASADVAMEASTEEAAPPARIDDRDGMQNLPRLRMSNIVKYCTPKDIKKWLDKNGIAYRNVKKGPKWEYAILGFDSESDRDKCIDNFNGALMGKLPVQFEKMLSSGDQHQLMLQRQEQRRARDAERPPDERSHTERLLDQVTPLHKLSYEEQLVTKQDEMVENFKKFAYLMLDVSKNTQREAINLQKKLRFKKAEDARTAKESDAADPAASTSKQATDEPEPAETDEPVEGETAAAPAEDDHAKTESVIASLNARVKEMQWVKDAQRANKGLLCPLETIIPSPITSGYRNKCEFTFGRDPHGEITVGFQLGGARDGQFAIMGVADCPHVSDDAKAIALILQDLAESSALQVLNRAEKKGYWRLALVRTHNSGDRMLFIQVDTDGVDKDVADSEKQRMVDFVTSKTVEQGIPIKTIIYQDSHADFLGFKQDEPFEILTGTGVVSENLLGNTFQISPSSFFQVNTLATEVLYTKVKELCLAYPKPAAEAVPEEASADTSNNVVLLDLCCGTGTIGITLAKHFKKVIGVEMVAEAIEDAKKNAAANGNNVTYLCGKVEDKIKEVFQQHVSDGDRVVALLDPPRAGVQSSVINAIRTCHGLDYVVYIACETKQANANFVQLCKPKTGKAGGKPFRPISAVPVDLFPHTKSCELVVSFER